MALMVKLQRPVLPTATSDQIDLKLEGVVSDVECRKRGAGAGVTGAYYHAARSRRPGPPRELFPACRV
jgi:hypothetical protein